MKANREQAGESYRGSAALRLCALLILAMSLLPAPASVRSQPGDGELDPTFGGVGLGALDFLGNDEARAVAIQADGKIVTAGTSNSNFALARQDQIGIPDTSFSGDGKQTTDFGGDDQARAMAIQADGKIVVAGAKVAVGIGDFAVARYNTNGSLDTSFSGDGKQTTDIGGGDDKANAVAIQADGKIVVVGSGHGESGRPADFAVARYNTNGSLDTSFSGDGKQTTEFGNFDEARAVAIQADGKIVVVGDTDDQRFALARYNQDGSLDTSFSGDGKQTTDFGGGDDKANAVAIQADGKIVVVGDTPSSVTEETINDFALARYNQDGSLDTSFSGDGKQTTDFGADDRANAVAIQADGKIVVAGSTGANPVSGAEDFAVARYNADGNLDTSFSGDGKQNGKQIGDFFDKAGANAVAIQADGKIVVAGFVAGFMEQGPGNKDFAMGRYLTTTYCITDNNNPGRFIGFSDGGSFSTANTGPGNNGVGVVGTGAVALAAGQRRLTAQRLVDPTYLVAGAVKGISGNGDVAVGGSKYLITDSTVNDRVCRVRPVR